MGNEYQIIQTKTGYVIAFYGGRRPEYCGCDGYWCREARNANPFRTTDAARAKLSAM